MQYTGENTNAKALNNDCSMRSDDQIQRVVCRDSRESSGPIELSRLAAALEPQSKKRTGETEDFLLTYPRSIALKTILAMLDWLKALNFCWPTQATLNIQIGTGVSSCFRRCHTCWQLFWLFQHLCSVVWMSTIGKESQKRLQIYRAWSQTDIKITPKNDQNKGMPCIQQHEDSIARCTRWHDSASNSAMPYCTCSFAKVAGYLQPGCLEADSKLPLCFQQSAH